MRLIAICLLRVVNPRKSLGRDTAAPLRTLDLVILEEPILRHA